MGHQKPKPKTVNCWTEGHANDELQRQQLINVFAQQPLTVGNLVRFMVQGLDEEQYQAPALHVVHGAVAMVAAKTLQEICRQLPELRRGPPELWRGCMGLALSTAKLLSHGYLLPQQQKDRVVPPHELVQWARDTWGDDAAAAQLELLAPGISFNNIDQLEALYQGPDKA